MTVLPNGWKKVKLGDVATISSGSTPLRSNKAYFENGNMPWVKTMDLTNGKITKTDECITELAAKKCKPYPTGTVLVAMYGGFNQIGRTGLLTFPASINQALAALQFDKDICSEYVLFYLNANVDRWRSCAASSRKDPNITSHDVEKFKIVLPPLEEQEKIAATLSVWDSAIGKMEKLVDAKIVQKNSLTYKLIENQNDGKFKLGNVTIDKSKWEKKSLKELGSFSKGQGIKRDEAHSGSIAAIRYGEIYTTHNDYIKEFYSFISEDVAKKSKLLKKGDLLFSCSGETKEDIGKCVAFVSDVVAYAGGDIIIFSPQIECDSKYLGFLLNARSINKQKYGLGQGDSIVHISAESIGRLTVFLPSYLEQKAIADVLSAIDDELSLLKQQLENYKKQKQGLMQKLLTGQWRVK